MTGPPEGLPQSPQDRHAVAGLLGQLSLRARLSLLVGFIVAVVVSAASFLELRMFERTLASELLDTARRTAIAVADDLELRSRTPGDPDDDPSDALHQFLEVNPAVRAITVVDLEGDNARVVASTSSGGRQVAISVARQAIASNDVVYSEADLLRFVGVPLAGPSGPMGVVVTVSMAAVSQVAQQGRLIAVLVAVPAVAIVTLLLDLLA